MHKKGTDPTTESALKTYQASAPIIRNSAEIEKWEATLRANFALLGYECRECVSGGYFVSRWNLARFCRDLSDVESFLQMVQRGQGGRE